jgi:hypothetical protein
VLLRCPTRREVCPSTETSLIKAEGAANKRRCFIAEFGMMLSEALAKFGRRTARDWFWSSDRSASRSQIKLMYGSHHQQPQKHGRNDEPDPFFVVREPSMHAIHGQPPTATIKQIVVLFLE